MDFSKYLNNIIEIDVENKRARVQPGCVLDHLRDETTKHNLTFGPDPATHTHCTLGGMTGNNSCGVHSQMAGRTSDNIEELEILTYDGLRMRVGPTSGEELQQIIRAGGRKGEIYSSLLSLRDKYADEIRRRYPKIPRRVSGYNLDELLPENGFNVARALVGSESTCVTLLEITGKLVYNPPARALLVLGFEDVFLAADSITEVASYGPMGLEGIDDRLLAYYRTKGLNLEYVAMMPEGEGWLIVEFGGETRKEAEEKAERLMEAMSRREKPPTMKLYENKKQESHIWAVRESSLGATAFVPNHPDTWEGWEDSAVAPEKLGDYLRKLRKLFEKYNYDAALYGHFGQGCVHCRINFDLVTEEGLRIYRSFMDEAADLVLGFGGSLSGEHGDGQSRAEFLPKMFGPELIKAFEEFKSIWDPAWKMNPGKVVLPYSITENLRLGTNYNPPDVKTHFQYPREGSFSRAALRCVGVGKCRRHKDGTMCPSYMVTLEEKHSTRGRARLLFEMLEGEAIQDGWRSDAVKEALDLCLACKGCKGECPVNVDMATYKAEFLSHYYDHKRRPRGAYAFGFIPVWARLAAYAPWLANFLNKAPVFSSLAKAAAGITNEREIPEFAPYTFKDWFRKRKTAKTAGREVVLWADTFNNHFHPTTAQAAVEVLEAAGFKVKVPLMNICCGRPLYDYGFLDVAKAWLCRIIEELREDIRAGTPVIVLEPSCASVFRDELLNLFPHDEDAKRLASETLLLTEFLQKHAPDFEWPKLNRKAIVHGHCHQKSVLGMKSEEELLAKLEIDYEVLDSGCCGMAGAFGFEEGEHYDVSIKCAQRVLLPAVEAAAKETLILADGFSCREQVSQLSDRKPLHVAQVLKMALDGDTGAVQYPEKEYVTAPPPPDRAAKAALLLAAAGIIGAGAVWMASRRK